MFLEVVGFLLLCVCNTWFTLFSMVTTTNMGFGISSIRQKTFGVLMLLLSCYFWNLLYNMVELY